MFAALLAFTMGHFAETADMDGSAPDWNGESLDATQRLFKAFHTYCGRKGVC